MHPFGPSRAIETLVLREHEIAFSRGSAPNHWSRAITTGRNGPVSSHSMSLLVAQDTGPSLHSGPALEPVTMNRPQPTPSGQSVGVDQGLELAVDRTFGTGLGDGYRDLPGLQWGGANHRVYRGSGNDSEDPRPPEDERRKTKDETCDLSGYPKAGHWLAAGLERRGQGACGGRLWRRALGQWSGVSAGSEPLIPISHASSVLCGHTGNRPFSMPGSPLLIYTRPHVE